MKPYLMLGALASLLFFPKGLLAQQATQPKSTADCRPISQGNTFIEPDEQIVGDQVCKKVVAAQPAPVAEPTKPPQQDSSSTVQSKGVSLSSQWAPTPLETSCWRASLVL